MASIEYVTISIVRTSSPAGHSCMVEYSYYLHTEKNEYSAAESYDVGCVLYGNDVLRHKTLGEPPYDVHHISSHEHMPLKRHFLVPCEILDEAWGKDNIYITVVAKSTHDANTVVSRNSDVVSDWF